jgi:hypothetical protein
VRGETGGQLRPLNLPRQHCFDFADAFQLALQLFVMAGKLLQIACQFFQESDFPRQLLFEKVGVS